MTAAVLFVERVETTHLLGGYVVANLAPLQLTTLGIDVDMMQREHFLSEYRPLLEERSLVVGVIEQCRRSRALRGSDGETVTQGRKPLSRVTVGDERLEVRDKPRVK